MFYHKSIYFMPFRKFYQKGESAVEIILGFLGGLLVAWVGFKKRFKNGNFQINESDMNKDVYTLYIDNFDKVHRRRYLLLRITRK